jgi:hypothetical protein
LFKSQFLPNRWQRDNIKLHSPETPHNLGDHPREVCFINHIREGHQNPNRKEESKIQIILDYIMENPSEESQIPLGVLKFNHIFLPKGQILTLLKDNLVTLLKGRLVIHLKLIKKTILPRVTLVILPRAKWVSFSFYAHSSTNES